MEKSLLLASSLVLFLSAESIQAMQVIQPYDISEKLYKNLSSLQYLSDSDVQQNKFALKYDGKIYYVNLSHAKLPISKSKFDSDNRKDWEQLLTRYYHDNYDKKLDAYNINLNGIGQDLHLALIGGMDNPKDIGQFLSVSKATKSLLEHKRFPKTTASVQIKVYIIHDDII